MSVSSPVICDHTLPPSLKKKHHLSVRLSLITVSRAAPHLRSQLLAVRNNMADIYGG